MVKKIMNMNENITPGSKEIAILKENFPACFRRDESFDIERFREFMMY